MGHDTDRDTAGLSVGPGGGLIQLLWGLRLVLLFSCLVMEKSTLTPSQEIDPDKPACTTSSREKKPTQSFACFFLVFRPQLLLCTVESQSRL